MFVGGWGLIGGQEGERRVLGRVMRIGAPRPWGLGRRAGALGWGAGRTFGWTDILPALGHHPLWVRCPKRGGSGKERVTERKGAKDRRGFRVRKRKMEVIVVQEGHT